LPTHRAAKRFCKAPAKGNLICAGNSLFHL
jgi:hypothetical protein